MTPPGKNSNGNIATRRRVGALCEVIATEHFFNLGYYVFHPWFGIGPVDLICIRSTPPEILLLDIKADAFRSAPATRISRVLTVHQRRLGVRICYVNPETREVYLVRHREARSPASPGDP